MTTFERIWENDDFNLHLFGRVGHYAAIWLRLGYVTVFTHNYEWWQLGQAMRDADVLAKLGKLKEKKA